MDGRVCVYCTYRYRIYPTRRQRLVLETHLQFACDLYNAALEQRRYEWRAGRPIGFVFQCRQLGRGMAHQGQDPLRRLDRSFQNFLRRVGAGQTPGYPRYRSRLRYDVLTWSGSWVIENRRLALPGIGHLKVRWHRGLPTAGSRHILTVRRRADRWYACIVLALLFPCIARQQSGLRWGSTLAFRTSPRYQWVNSFPGRVRFAPARSGCERLSDESPGESRARDAGRRPA